MSIRLRLALVFTAAAALLFALGSWLFVTQLSSALLSTIDSQLASQLAQAGRFVSPSGSSPAGSPKVAAALPGEYLVQVIDAAGVVRGASQDAGSQPLLTATELRRASSSTTAFTTSQEGEQERVMAGPFRSHPHWTAVAIVSLDAFDHTQGDVSGGLAIGGAVFVLAAGFGSYGLARAALSPVERMRRQVASVSESEPAPSVQVPRTKDEIAALARTMNDLVARLQQALARQRAFVADASHELRTPFAVLQGELELARRPGRTRQELETALANASEEAARLARLTEDLLLLARSDEQRLSLNAAPVAVGTLVGRSVDHFRTRAVLAGVECVSDVDAGLVAEIDANRIRQAIDNLVDNALRFAPAGSTVTIHAHESAGTLVVDVEDSGQGFPPEFLPHAFERFRRPDTGRARDDGGAGLGLAIVSAITLAHGGNATAANRPEGGARVRLELPGTVSAAR